MGKNLIWSADDLKKKGLAQDSKGNYVPVKTLAAKGKVEKIDPMAQIAIPKGMTDEQREELKSIDATKIYQPPASDLILATGYAMYVQKQKAAGIDPIDMFTKGYAVRTEVKDDKLLQEMIELSRFYSSKILTEKTTIRIKPLTQNRAWKGRRFKSDQYKVYASAVDLLLPSNLIIPEGLLRVYYEFGMSRNSDFDNPCKMFTDILQEKYKFNDSRIMEANIKKVIVKKGEEYISFKIESL